MPFYPALSQRTTASIFSPGAEGVLIGGENLLEEFPSSTQTTSCFFGNQRLQLLLGVRKRIS